MSLEAGAGDRVTCRVNVGGGEGAAGPRGWEGEEGAAEPLEQLPLQWEDMGSVLHRGLCHRLQTTAEKWPRGLVASVHLSKSTSRGAVGFKEQGSSSVPHGS